MTKDSYSPEYIKICAEHIATLKHQIYLMNQSFSISVSFWDGKEHNSIDLSDSEAKLVRPMILKRLESSLKHEQKHLSDVVKTL